MNSLARFLRHPFGLVAATIVLAVPGAILLPPTGPFGLYSLTASAVLAVGTRLLIPFLLIRGVLRKPLSAFGWKRPDNILYASTLTTGTILLFLPILFFLAGIESLTQYYALPDVPLAAFLFVHVIVAFVAYLSQEFLYRGFLLFSLFPALGYWSIVIVGILSAVFHAGKPFPEIAFAFVAGIVFCVLALKTKSIFPGAVAHLLLSLAFALLLPFSTDGMFRL